jgi:hypothetical protein
MFRVWNKVTREEFFNYLINSDGILCDSHGEFIYKEDRVNLVIERYIGHKDINNNLIYEGDIVSCVKDDDNDRDIVELTIRSIEEVYSLSFYESNGGPDRVIRYSSFKVIGHI